MNPLVISTLLKNKTVVIVGSIIAVGVVGLTLWKGKQAMCYLGLSTCNDNYRKRLTNLKFLYPNYYDATKISITHQMAKVIADKLADATSGADDEEAVYSLLQQAKTKNNMSLISKYYQIRHGQSLIDVLAYDMGSKEEMKRIMKILKALN